MITLLPSNGSTSSLPPTSSDEQVRQDGILIIKNIFNVKGNKDLKVACMQFLACNFRAFSFKKDTLDTILWAVLKTAHCLKIFIELNRLSTSTYPVAVKKIENPRSIWYYLLGMTKKGIQGISFFYSSLTTKPEMAKDPDKLKWEKDLSQSFSLVQWRKAIYLSYKVSSCIDHWDIFQKIFYKWYMTPYGLSNINTSQLCWRLCN